MLTRRAALLTPLWLAALKAEAAGGKMTLGMHQNTSSAAGYRKSLEGWARAGIKHVELTSNLLDDFLKTDSLDAARRVLTDNGLTPVSAACGVSGLWEPNPKHAAALDDLKRRCEMFGKLGLTRIYAPTATTQKFTPDDYKAGARNMHDAGEVVQQFKMTIMVEALRTSTFVSTLTTLLTMIREAGHPQVKPLLDFYHFWSGLSKFEDLDLIRPGEIGHVHFQDVPDLPRELLDSSTRAIPGDGIAPVDRILRKIADKNYAGTLSVELFLPRLVDGDPYEVASEIKRKAERVMQKARVG
jgi:sugar phosphate isomerase/epimerase